MKLEESQFYLLVAPHSDRCLCGDAPGAVRVREQVNCAVDPSHARIGRFFSHPNVAIPCVPPSDLLHTWCLEWLVQERVLEIFAREQLTGFWTTPAKAVVKETGEPIAASQLRISGWGGVAPPESGIRLDETCPGCAWAHWTDLTNPEGLIEPRNWDGSDFFMIWPLPRFILVSKKAHRVFVENGFTGAGFTKTFPKTTGGGFSPQRLSYSMPEQRAHEIGDSLGIY